MSEATLTLSDPEIVLQLFGPHDSNLKQVRNQLGVAITHRGGQIRVSGESESVRLATEILEKLKERAYRNGRISSEEVTEQLHRVTGVKTGITSLKSPILDTLPLERINGERIAPQEFRQEVAIGNPQRRIRPRTEGQAAYVEAIRKHDMTFCIGPAGTGKTYLAVATAVEALKARMIRKIVLVRPAVEAGESLGYLPGDLQAKLNPYLRPLLDAINEMVDFDHVKYLMEQDTIEVIPLAYMRGRTLNHAFIILDEAQNSTVAQMKMFLTRMGEGSKVVVSGDASQVDLPPGVTSGLRDAAQRLQGIKEIAFVRLTETDIVRHALVKSIVKAYDAPGSAVGSSPRADDR
ncbi:MAG: PhoH family protein [Pirellulaceae bacterium]|nr:PhoH family protein [Pirellulaceae bacterium]